MRSSNARRSISRCFRRNPVDSSKGAHVLVRERCHQKGRDAHLYERRQRAHNIYSTTKGNEFNLGSQSPGTSTDVTFNEAGEVQVMCAIHPRMTMTVKVVD
jgi:hypothetical protein